MAARGGGRPAPGRPARGRARRSAQASDLGARLAAAVPAVIFALVIVGNGGLVFALGVIFLGVIGMHELYSLMRRARPVDIAGFLSLVALVLVALYDGGGGVLLVLVLSFPATFLLAVARPWREDVAWGIAATLFGIFWIGLALAHAVLLREHLPHGGALLLDTLIGTFIGDTVAYFAGRRWGRTQLAPWISPNKSVEGLLAGVAGGTLAFWAFSRGYHHEWFAGPDALLIGLSVAIAAPVGDLFQSLLKRDLHVKDTGRLFGAHGGVLDRLDAVMFTVVTAYYVSRALLL